MPVAYRPGERRVPLDERVPRVLLALAGESHQVKDRQIAADLVRADLCRRPATRDRAHAHPPGQLPEVIPVISQDSTIKLSFIELIKGVGERQHSRPGRAACPAHGTAPSRRWRTAGS